MARGAFVEPVVFLGEVVAPVVVEVAVADQGAQGEDGFGAVQSPAGSGDVEAVADQVAAGSFDDVGDDEPARAAGTLQYGKLPLGLPDQRQDFATSAVAVHDCIPAARSALLHHGSPSGASAAFRVVIPWQHRTGSSASQAGHACGTGAFTADSHVRVVAGFSSK